MDEMVGIRCCRSKLADQLLRTRSRRDLGRGERVLAAPLVLHPAPHVGVDLLDLHAPADLAAAKGHARAAVDAAVDRIVAAAAVAARLEAALPVADVAGLPARRAF